MSFAPSRRSTERGFTIIEMMASLVVLGVMLVIAIPNLAAFVRTSKVRSAQSEIVASLMLARSEAAKRGVAVSVAASAPTTGSEFSAGWTVWVDANGNGAIDNGELVIRSYPDISSAVTLGTTGSVSSLTFAPTGFLTPATVVNFKVCGKTGATKGYAIALQPVGLADLKDQVTCP